MGIKLARTDIDLAAEIADELEQLRTAHPHQGIEFTVTGDAHGQWDHSRLKQVLRNLVSNAIKYGAPEMPVRVALRDDGAEVRLEVSNSGGNIDPTVQTQWFQPLQRGVECSGIQEAPDGLGLGLFIVREIVSAHGGEIEVCSEGEGTTTFAVRLRRQTQNPSR